MDLRILNPLRSLVVFKRSFRCGQARFCLIEIPSVIIIVKLHQSLPCSYLLVVADIHFSDCAGNTSTQRGYIGSKVSIVCTLVRPIAFPCGPVTSDHKQQTSSNEQYDDRYDQRLINHALVLQFRVFLLFDSPLDGQIARWNAVEIGEMSDAANSMTRCRPRSKSKRLN